MDDQQVNCMFNAMAKCQSFFQYNDVPAEDGARSFLFIENYGSENSPGFQVCDASCIDEGKSLFSKPQHDCQSLALDTMKSLVEPGVKLVEERKSKKDILFMLQRIYEDVLNPLYFVARAGELDECIKLLEFATSLLDILRRHNILGPESDPRQELNSLLNKARETVLKNEIQPETVVTFPSSNPTSSSLLILDNQHLSCSTENKIPLTVEELASTVSDDDDVGNPKRARRGKGQKRVGRRLKEQIN